MGVWDYFAVAMVWLKDSGLETVWIHPWLSLLTAVGAYVGWRFIRRPRNLPPGPVGIPGLGAVAWIREDVAKLLYEARPKYGDVICFYIGTKPHIFLNSYDAIMEGFVRRGEDFAARPAEHEAVSLGMGFISELFSVPYSEKWKGNKKFAMSTLRAHGFGTPKSESKIQEQLDRLEYLLVSTDGAAIDPRGWIGPLVTGTIVSILYSGDFSWSDPQMTEVFKLAMDMVPLFETMFFLDSFSTSFPIWLIKAGSWIAMRRTRKHFEKSNNFMSVKIDEHRRTLDTSNPRDVLDTYLIGRHGDPDLDDDVLSSTLVTLLPGFVDIVTKAMSWIVLYVTSYPEVQKRLHDLLDEVCGSSRHPTLADRPRLAYVDAIILEVLRITYFPSTTPARAALRDTTFRGYTIPKGTPITANIHAVHFDPAVHPDPMTFNPDRFIDGDGKLVNAGKVMSFSVGPRACMGTSMAKVQLFLFTTRIFKLFHFKFPAEEPSPSLSSKPFSFPTAYRVRALQR